MKLDERGNAAGGGQRGPARDVSGLTQLAESATRGRSVGEGLFTLDGDCGADEDPGLEVVVLDINGVIVEVNQAWLGFGEANGATSTKVGVGASYLSSCASAGGGPQADQMSAAIRTALAGELETPTCIAMSCHAPEELRWFEAAVRSNIDDQGICQGAVVSFRLVNSMLTPWTANAVLAEADAEADAGIVRDEAHGPRVPEPAEGFATTGEQSADAWRAVLGLVSDGVVVVDNRGMIIEANAQAEGLLGFDTGDLVAVPSESVLPGCLAVGTAPQSPVSGHQDDSDSGGPCQVTRAVQRDGTEVSLLVQQCAVSLGGELGTLLVLSDRLSSTTSAAAPQLDGASRSGSFLEDLLPVISRIFRTGSVLTGAMGPFDKDSEIARKVSGAVSELDRAIDELRVIAAAVPRSVAR